MCSVWPVQRHCRDGYEPAGKEPSACIGCWLRLLRRRQVPSHANGAIAGSRARRGSLFWPVAPYRRRPPSHRQRPRGSGLLRADHEGLASTRLKGGGGVPHTRRVDLRLARADRCTARRCARAPPGTTASLDPATPPNYVCGIAKARLDWFTRELAPTPTRLHRSGVRCWEAGNPLHSWDKIWSASFLQTRLFGREELWILRAVRCVALLSTSQLPLVWRRCPPAQHCR